MYKVTDKNGVELTVRRACDHSYIYDVVNWPGKDAGNYLLGFKYKNDILGHVSRYPSNFETNRFSSTRLAQLRFDIAQVECVIIGRIV